jgi:hypothetical protein
LTPAGFQIWSSCALLQGHPDPVVDEFRVMSIQASMPAASTISRSGPRDGRLARLGDLEDSNARRRIYGWVAVALFFIGLGMMAIKARHGYRDRRFDFACSDGKYYYAYIASAVVDGNLDSAILLHHWGYADDASTPRDARGNLRNIYPIGVSLTVVPSVLLAHITSLAVHGVTKSAWFAPDGYSTFYQLFNFAWINYLAFATFVMLDSLMARYFKLKGTAITLAILASWVGTQYVYHELRFPLMSVVIAPFWATALIYLAAKAIDRLEESRVVSWHWAGMVFCFAMAVICRNTNVMLATFFIYPFYQLIRAGLIPKLLARTPLLLLGCAPVLLQMCMWKYQSGHFINNSYGATAQFYWLHPAFWQIMFSLRAGMFVWVPVWTLGTIGAIIYLRGSRGSWMLVCYLASFLIIWYVNSAYWAWPFSNYPNRGFVELIGLPAIGLGLLIQHTERSLARRRLVLGLVVLSSLVTIAMGLAYDTRRVPRYGDVVNAMGPYGARWAR